MSSADTLNAIHNGQMMPKDGDFEADRGKMHKPKKVEHGTDSGYYRHRNQSDGWDRVACQPCLDAHAARQRERTGHTPTPRELKPPRKWTKPVLSCATRRPPRGAVLTWIPRGGISVAVWSVRRG